MRDNCFDPMLQRRMLPEQATRKIVSSAGRQERERCVGIDWCWLNVEIVFELEKAFSGFTERSVAANNNYSLDPGSQRSARFDRRIARGFGFVCLILNAGSVELFPDRGPQAPRTGGAVVDDDESSDLRYPRARARLAAKASSRARGIASTARATCGSASLKTCVAVL